LFEYADITAININILFISIITSTHRKCYGSMTEHADYNKETTVVFCPVRTDVL